MQNGADSNGDIRFSHFGHSVHAVVASRTSLLAVIRLYHSRRPCALWFRTRRADESDFTAETHCPTCRLIRGCAGRFCVLPWTMHPKCCVYYDRFLSSNLRHRHVLFFDKEHEIINIKVAVTPENRQKKRPDTVVSGKVF